MNAPSSIPGILDEYCWMHTPGGWDCSVCWAQIHLTAFFEAVAMIGAFQIDWHILIAEDALDMHLVHYNAYYKWLMKWRRESEVEG